MRRSLVHRCTSAQNPARDSQGRVSGSASSQQAQRPASGQLQSGVPRQRVHTSTVPLKAQSGPVAPSHRNASIRAPPTPARHNKSRGRQPRQGACCDGCDPRSGRRPGRQVARCAFQLCSTWQGSVPGHRLNQHSQRHSCRVTRGQRGEPARARPAAQRADATAAARTCPEWQPCLDGVLLAYQTRLRRQQLTRAVRQ